MISAQAYRLTENSSHMAPVIEIKHAMLHVARAPNYMVIDYRTEGFKQIVHEIECIAA